MADESNPHAAPISTELHLVHVESLKAALETLDVTDEQAKMKAEIDEQAKVKAEIEASKVHWSELASTYYTCVEGPTMDSSSTSLPQWVHKEGTPEWKLEVAEDNKHVFRSLQEKYPGGFFIDENDLEVNSIQWLPKWMFVDGVPIPFQFGLSSATPFAEGGQAKLFHVHTKMVHCNLKLEVMVMKVFKEEMPLRDLLKLFPITMLANDQICVEGSFGTGLENCIPIYGARLLKSTRRFAFLMRRAWGDLRKLIDERMLHFNNQGAPFSNDVSFYIIHHIAKGMMELHERGIIHRDLKAANVLVFAALEDMETGTFRFNPLHLQPYEFECYIADFECSVGIVGTRFWRAPEILQVVKNRDIFQKPELFTKQADVYSFGMTCYEILSGGMPFEKLQTNHYDGVIGGMRPMLPIQTPPWMVDLVNRCWYQDPSMRPPFEEIVKILLPYVPKDSRKL